MKTLRLSTQYKKDFKRYRNNLRKVEKILSVFRILERGEELPAELKAHKLLGQYKGCIECHIEGDFLLIWMDEDGLFIDIIRIGTHSELFKR